MQAFYNVWDKQNSDYHAGMVCVGTEGWWSGVY